MEIKSALVGKQFDTEWLDHAGTLHDDYLEAYSTWINFSQQRGNQIFLWNTIRDVLERSNTNSNLDLDDIMDALGLTAWTFDDPNATFELGQTTVDDLIDLEDKINVNYQGDNKFVTFGRELVPKRLRLEKHAKILTDYMAYGRCQCNHNDCPDPKNTDTSFDPKFKDGDPHVTSRAENLFYAEFSDMFYQAQVRIARQLLPGLTHPDAGRQFLVSLFEEPSPVFEPDAFLDPPMVAEKDDSTGGVAILAATVKAEVIFDLVTFGSDDTPALRGLIRDSSTGELVMEAPAVAQDLSKLVAPLLVGAARFYAEDRGSRLSRVERFMGLVAATFVTDDQLQQITSQQSTSWSPLLDSKRAWSRNHSQWKISDSLATVKALNAVGGNVIEELETGGKKAAAPLQFLFTGYGLLTTAITAAKGDLRTDQAMELVVETAKNLGSVGGLANAIGIELKHVGEVSSNASKRIAARVLVFFQALGPIFDLIDTIKSLLDTKAEIGSGDYDASAAKALAAGGGIVSLAAGIGQALGAKAFFGLALGWVAVIAAAIGIIAAILYTVFNDGPIVEWLRQTYFGSNWGRTSGAVYDPKGVGGFTSAPYRYASGDPAKLPEPDDIDVDDVRFGPQLSDFFALVRPLNATAEMTVGTYSPSFNTATRSFTDIPVGRIKLEPAALYQSQSFSPFATAGSPTTPDTKIVRRSWLAVESIRVQDVIDPFHAYETKGFTHVLSFNDGYANATGGGIHPGWSTVGIHLSTDWTPDNKGHPIHFVPEVSTQRNYSVDTASFEFWLENGTGHPEADLFAFDRRYAGSGDGRDDETQLLMLYHLPQDISPVTMDALVSSYQIRDLLKIPTISRQLVEVAYDLEAYYD